jgi:hypothetical protein
MALYICLFLIVARRTGAARGKNHPWSLSLENLRHIIYIITSLGYSNRNPGVLTIIRKMYLVTLPRLLSQQLRDSCQHICVRYNSR